jgi:ketosteroid isomerase-like protein
MKMRPLILPMCIFAAVLVSLSIARSENTQSQETSMNDKTSQELLELEKNFQKAVMENDAEAITRFIADDWIIVDAEGAIIQRDKFLAIIKSGTLTHDAMNLEQPRVRVYGTTAVVTGRATSSGKYMGTPFKTLERSTDVFVKVEDQWRCVLTQLSPLPADKND